MNDTVFMVEVSDDDGLTWALEDVKPSSPVIAYLHNQGSPWYDVASGYTYRWLQ